MFEQEICITFGQESYIWAKKKLSFDKKVVFCQNTGIVILGQENCIWAIKYYTFPRKMEIQN